MNRFNQLFRLVYLSIAFIFSVCVMPQVQADLVFELINSPVDQEGATLTGFIVLDGTDAAATRVLSETNIVSWSVRVDKGTNSWQVVYDEQDAELNLIGTLSQSADTLVLNGQLDLGRNICAGDASVSVVAWDSAASPQQLYYATHAGDQSKYGWLSNGDGFDDTNPGLWTIAAIPEPTVLSLLLACGGAMLVGRRISRKKSTEEPAPETQDD